MLSFLHRSAMQTNFFSLTEYDGVVSFCLKKKRGGGRVRQKKSPRIREKPSSLMFSNECVIIYNTWNSFNSREWEL